MGHAFSAKALLRDLAAAREDTLWSAMRAITVEADLARRLAEGSLAMTGKRLIFSKQGADRAGVQADQIRAILVSASDLIEPAV